VNQGSEVREYVPGDRIEVELTVEHDFKLKGVAARFEHEEATPDSPDSYRIDLKTPTSGGRRRAHPPIIQQTERHSTPPGATSRVTLETKVDREQTPGEYRCTRVQTRGPGGSPISFEQVPDIRFRVVEEPVERPRVVGVEFKR